MSQGLRAFFEKSSAALLIFSLGVALGLVSFMQVPRAHAALGNDIVCFVYSQLNGVGSPIPFLNADGCPGTPPADTGTIKIIKVVSGSSASPSSFTIHLKNPSSDVGGSPQPGSSAGTSYIGLPIGSYVVSEDPVSGYTTSFSSSCPAGVIALGANSTVTCTVTNTAVITPPPPTAQCADGLDNDTDGLVDMADPGCSSASDNDETNGGGGSTTQCSDGTDNDNDGLIDLADPGCTNAADNDETNSGGGGSTTQCSDGVDNDGDNLVDMSDPGCTSASDNDETNTTGGGGSGSTPACRDGVDNDADNLVDSADPGCHSDGNASNSASYDSNGTTEANSNTGGGGTGGGGGGSLPQCQDGQDNDNDGTKDSADSGCHNDGNASNAASYEMNWNDEAKTFGSGTGNAVGEVLGTSTASCTALLSSYMRMGRSNNADEVMKLQNFLNQVLDAKLPVTGFFGSLTDRAVRNFQIKYNTEVLTPWVAHGLPTDKTSTGYVYKTTLRMINNLYCNTLNLPIPNLP